MDVAVSGVHLCAREGDCEGRKSFHGEDLAM